LFRRSSIRAARGLMIMINCQSVQSVQMASGIGDDHHGCRTFTILGWLLAWWTPSCNLSGGAALIVWFTTNGMCAKNKNIYMRGANKQY